MPSSNAPFKSFESRIRVSRFVRLGFWSSNGFDHKKHSSSVGNLVSFPFIAVAGVDVVVCYWKSIASLSQDF